jgi:hypothetical protein
MSRMACNIHESDRSWLKGQMDVEGETFDIEVKGTLVVFKLSSELTWYGPYKVDAAIKMMKNEAKRKQEQLTDTKQTLLLLNEQSESLKIAGKTVAEVFEEMGYTRI